MGIAKIGMTAGCALSICVGLFAVREVLVGNVSLLGGACALVALFAAYAICADLFAES